MATTTTTHSRARSSTFSGPHSLSLKVLRLSRPALATQAPLPPTAFGNGLDIAPNASLAYSTADSTATSQDEKRDTSAPSSFPLTQALTLPAAFGAAYVGETFVCTLCVNNELPPSPSSDEGGGGSGEGNQTIAVVSGVKIVAELQTPTRNQAGDGGIALPLEGAASTHEDEGEGGEGGGVKIKPGETLQRTLRHELKDEGQYVLAVTVSYTEETLLPQHGGTVVGSRTRSFRKLYQFISQQLVAVRSKVTERKKKDTTAAREWVLEAQLENVADGGAGIVLEKVWLKESEEDGVVAKAMMDVGGTVLKPGDIEQIMFLVKEDKKENAEDVDLSMKVRLGQLNIDWRSAMGEKGSLTTGWLSSRGR